MSPSAAAAPRQASARALPASWSLRRRVLLVITSASVLAWVAGAWATWSAAADADARVRDARLVQLATTIVSFAEHELAEIARDRADGVHDSTVHIEGLAEQDRYLYQLFSLPGRELLLRSANAPAAEALVPSHSAGFGEQLDARGQRLRTYVLRSTLNPVEIQVAEPIDTPLGMLRPTAARFGAVAALSLLAVTALAAWWVMRAMRPLTRMADDVARRQPMDDRALAAAEAPLELQPLVGAIEGLMQRATEQLSHERGFTALAAHELRTPLAALRLQAQLAAREVDDARRRDALASLVASVDRCSHLAGQLVALARVESAQRFHAAPLALPALVDEVVAELQPLARGRGATLEIGPLPSLLHADAFGLHVLLRNLLANAVQHGGPRVRLTTSTVAPGPAAKGSADDLVVDVDDDGTGVAPALRERVLEPFDRGRSLPATDAPDLLAVDGPHPGAGLGLAVVLGVARAHGATLQLSDSPLGGLRARVSFPAAVVPAGSPGRAP